MALPINITDLIHKKTVESSRIELKKGWNPEEVIRTMCAFANDINELGGGYIIIGIEEVDGSPVLPPIGIAQTQLDNIQKKFVELCNRIDPTYFAVIEPIEYQGRHIIIIWATTGEERPYTAPTTLGKKAQRKIYVRPSSVTIPASPVLEKRLRELATHLHFDNRVNRKAILEDLDLGLIQAYLQEINSQLYEQITTMSMEKICLSMQIARGPKENIRPLNVGLLLFSKRPEKYFDGCITNLVEFDDAAGTSYTKKEFKGPIHLQIKAIMGYLNTSLIRQYTRKNGNILEAKVFYNYPYQALEETVVNALYHRSYQNIMPTEIRIFKEISKSIDDRRIEILSYPGPLPPIDEEALLQLKVTARSYRNIKLGGFLKNLRLIEAHATGIPTIVNSLERNGSPKPIFSTDKTSAHFLAVIKIHPDTPDETSSPLQEEAYIHLSDIQQRILELLLKEPSTLEGIQQKFKNDIAPEIKFFKEKGLIGEKKISNIILLFINEKGRDALNNSF